MVRTISLLFLISTAILGCGGPPPVTPQGFDSLDELTATLTESLASGEYDRMWACVYPEGDEVSKDAEFRKSVEGMYDWGRGLGLKLRCVRVLEVQEFPQPTGPQEFKGRPIVPNFEPSHLVAIHYWKPPAERDPEGIGSATFAYNCAVGQVDGKWWGVGAKFVQSEPKVDEPSSESAESLPPLGEELSEVPGVTLKRSEGPFTELGFNSLFVKSEDGMQMTRAPKGAHLLGDLLLDVMPFEHWTKDFHLLPDGYYTFSVVDMPKSREECFALVTETLESSFDLKIEAGETPWDAFRITVPDKLPQDVWADPDAEWSMNGGQTSSADSVDTYQLTGITFAEFEEWLSEHLDGPVTIVNPREGKFSMDVLIGGVEQAKLLELWLKEGGFGVERYQTPVPTVTVSRAATEEVGK